MTSEGKKDATSKDSSDGQIVPYGFICNLFFVLQEFIHAVCYCVSPQSAKRWRQWWGCYCGVFSDPDHPDFVHRLKVSGIGDYTWENNWDIICMYRRAFLRGIYCTGLMSAGPVSFGSYDNDILRTKEDQQLSAGADPLAVESPVNVTSSNAAPPEGPVVVEWLLRDSAL
ncbi:hypothetical protein llap_19450 [Limosa lapponica baueri]|uniref:Uncharacterized protein n=1 Tax=Limosa lapponica baueri TaxID=1758121 RepID=A0A2I0T8X2_LIMLA|nr:hypothetical protein llap_19450 [Limosa lapponica baueri]